MSIDAEEIKQLSDLIDEVNEVVGITLKIFHQPIFDSQKPLPTT
jgi:hypothetical protein